MSAKKKTTKKKVAKKAAKMGRPTAYKQDYARMAGVLARRGLTDAEMAEAFGVKEQTVNNWKTAHPDFFESLKLGKEFFDSQIERKLAERAMGYSHSEVKTASHEGKITDVREFNKHYPPDVTACIFWLKNRKPKEWRDKIELGGDEDRPIKITIGGNV